MKNNVMQFFFVTALLQGCCVWASTRLEKEQEILKNILERNNYNPSVRPSGLNESGPTSVTYNLFVRNINNFDDKKMEYSMQITFRQQWTDGRLSYRQAEVPYLSLTDPHRVWTPDPFFSNEKEGHFHNIVKPNVLLRIYPNGDILYSIRLSVTLHCPMHLKHYPMDIQTCSLIVASYGYTTADLIMFWKNLDPVQVSKNIYIPKFTLEKFVTDYCTSKTKTGEYSCLSLHMQYRRELGHYFSEIYLPTIILVMISWLCFWLDQKAAIARLLIWTTVFLAFSMKLWSFSSEVPPTNYTTAYSTWTTTCFLFLVAVVVEIGLVTFLVTRKERRNYSEMISEGGDAEKKEVSSESEPQLHSNVVFRVYHRLMRRYPHAQQKTDVICRVLFPVCFALFNIIYWKCNMPNSD